MGMKILHTATRVIGPLYAPDGSVLYDPASDGALKNASKLSAYPLVLGTDVPHDSASGVGAAPAAGPFPWSGITGLPSLVNSFNGRSGTVSPASGDYSAAQVTNAAATNAANTFSADQTFTGKVIPNGGIVRSGTAAANLLFNSIAALGLQGWGNNGGVGAGDWANWYANSFNGVENSSYFKYSGTSAGAFISSPYIPFGAGNPITLSGEIFNSGAGGSSSFEVYCFDSSHTQIGNAIAVSSVAAGSGWTYKAASATTPANTAYVTVTLSAYGAASATNIAFSELKLEQNDHASPYSQEADGNQTQWSSLMQPTFTGETITGDQTVDGSSHLMQGFTATNTAEKDVHLDGNAGGTGANAAHYYWARRPSGSGGALAHTDLELIVFDGASYFAPFAVDYTDKQIALGDPTFETVIGKDALFPTLATPPTDAGAFSFDGTHFRGGNGSAAETLAYTEELKASGSWTPAAGTFNITAGTVINIASIPTGVTNLRILQQLADSTYSFLRAEGQLLGSSMMWVYSSGGAGHVTALSSTTTYDISGNSSTAASVIMTVNDTTNLSNGYFQINNGQLQWVCVVAGATGSYSPGMTIQWSVW